MYYKIDGFIVICKILFSYLQFDVFLICFSLCVFESRYNQKMCFWACAGRSLSYGAEGWKYEHYALKGSIKQGNKPAGNSIREIQISLPGCSLVLLSADFYALMASMSLKA